MLLLPLRERACALARADCSYIDTHLLFLFHAIGTETMQEYVHALGTSLLIGETRAGDIAIFVHLFQQGTFYAQVIFLHISHFILPFSFWWSGLFARSVPLLHLNTEPLSQPLYRGAAGLVMRESTVFVDVAHNIGFFH